MLYPDRLAAAKLQPWMNGTSVTINKSKNVKAFLADKADSFGETKYKTVNIYSLSLKSWNRIVRRLDKSISDGKVNDYYETVFAQMIADGSLSLESVSFDGKPWYEIDTLADLAIAEKLFSSDDYRDMKTAPPLTPRFLDTPLINVVIPTQEATEVLSVAK